MLRSMGSQRVRHDYAGNCFQTPWQVQRDSSLAPDTLTALKVKFSTSRARPALHHWLLPPPTCPPHQPLSKPVSESPLGFAANPTVPGNGVFCKILRNEKPNHTCKTGLRMHNPRHGPWADWTFPAEGAGRQRVLEGRCQHPPPGRS